MHIERESAALRVKHLPELSLRTEAFGGKRLICPEEVCCAQQSDSNCLTRRSF